MNQRFQTLVYGTIFGLIIGWVLYIGRDVIIPIVFGVLVFYVIVGLTRLMSRIPLLGPHLPSLVRHSLSIVVIGIALTVIAYLAIASKNNVVALAPQYQNSLLSAIQTMAAFLHMENEPTWATLRQDLLGQVNMQRVIGATVTSVTSIVVGLLVVVLYAALLLIEQRSFAAKIANLSSDPRRVSRIKEVTSDINARIGAYLGMKTLLSILLGVLCWLAWSSPDCNSRCSGRCSSACSTSFRTWVRCWACCSRCSWPSSSSAGRATCLRYWCR